MEATQLMLVEDRREEKEEGSDGGREEGREGRKRKEIHSNSKNLSSLYRVPKMC